MTEPSTCGQGLAEHAALHRQLARLLEAMALNLELHLTALDPTNTASRPEHEAYTALVGVHRDLVARLAAAAEQMVSYRDLPLAEHDPAVLASPEIVGAFQTFIREEEALLALLQQWVERDRAMLAAG